MKIKDLLKIIVPVCIFVIVIFIIFFSQGKGKFESYGSEIMNDNPIIYNDKLVLLTFSANHEFSFNSNIIYSRDLFLQEFKPYDKIKLPFSATNRSALKISDDEIVVLAEMSDRPVIYKYNFKTKEAFLENLPPEVEFQAFKYFVDVKSNNEIMYIAKDAERMYIFDKNELTLKKTIPFDEKIYVQSAPVRLNNGNIAILAKNGASLSNSKLNIVLYNPNSDEIEVKNISDNKIFSAELFSTDVKGNEIAIVYKSDNKIKMLSCDINGQNCSDKLIRDYKRKEYSGYSVNLLEKNKLIFIGGEYQYENDEDDDKRTALKTAWIYNIETGKITNIKRKMPSERVGHNTMNLDDKTIIIFQGRNNSRWLTDFYIFKYE